MKVVFLDRDGVLNKYPGDGDYVKSLEEFHVFPQAVDAVKKLNEAGCKVFIVSNQACVGRGIISQSQLDELDAHLKQKLAEGGASIVKSYYATARPDAGNDDRKPKIGSIVKAFDYLGISMEQYIADAVFVGDSEKDIQCAKNAGCKSVFVLSGGYGRSHMADWSVQPDYVADDLAAAVNWILG